MSIERPALKGLARAVISSAVESAASDLIGVQERYEFLTEDEANDLLDLLKEVRIAATWADD